MREQAAELNTTALKNPSTAFKVNCFVEVVDAATPEYSAGERGRRKVSFRILTYRHRIFLIVSHVLLPLALRPQRNPMIGA